MSREGIAAIRAAPVLCSSPAQGGAHAACARYCGRSSDGRSTERKRRTPSPSLPRLRGGEIPGIRGESRPYATIGLVLAGFAGTLLWRAALVGSTNAIELWARFGTHLWWRLLVAPFTYTNTGSY